jgi:hypothetical protein
MFRGAVWKNSVSAHKGAGSGVGQTFEQLFGPGAMRSQAFDFCKNFCCDNAVSHRKRRIESAANSHTDDAPRTGIDRLFNTRAQGVAIPAAHGKSDIRPRNKARFSSETRNRKYHLVSVDNQEANSEPEHAACYAGAQVRLWYYRAIPVAPVSPPPPTSLAMISPS